MARAALHHRMGNQKMLNGLAPARSAYRQRILKEDNENVITRSVPGHFVCVQ
jgi:hypothetical protein